MPVPASINDLSTTASSNSPAGGESPTDGDNYIRTHASFIAALRDKLNGTSAAGTLLTPTLSGDTTADYVFTPTVCGVIAYRSGSTSYSAGTNTLVFDVESADRGGDYNNSTGIFTAPETGLYQVNCVLTLQNGTLSSVTLNYIVISKNDSTSAGSAIKFAYLTVDGGTLGAGGNSFNATSCAMLSLTAGDTIRIKENHTGANLSLMAGSHLSISWVG